MTANAGESREQGLAPRTPENRGLIPADTFGNRLLLVRKMLGLSQREAAEQTGLNYGSWSNWENGMKPADALGVIDAICWTFSIDREWLTFGGPLLPARGRRISRSASPDTGEYPDLSIQSTPQGPSGRPRSSAPAAAVRRPRLIRRAHPLAA
jgi:DNA-binding XRE family transcriptional regulator